MLYLNSILERLIKYLNKCQRKSNAIFEQNFANAYALFEQRLKGTLISKIKFVFEQNIGVADVIFKQNILDSDIIFEQKIGDMQYLNKILVLPMYYWNQIFSKILVILIWYLNKILVMLL